MHDEWMVCGATFGAEDGCDCFGVQGVSRQAIHSFCRQADQLTPCQGLRRVYYLI